MWELIIPSRALTGKGRTNSHCKKAFDILTIAFVIRVATVDQDSPLWQPAVGSKTHMEYRKADVATRAGKFAKASDKCYTQQKGIVS